MDESIKKLVTDAKVAAEKVMNGERLNHDAIDAIKTLLIVADLAQSLNQNSDGQNADARFVKRKLEALRVESKTEKKNFEAFKSRVIQTVLEEFRVINTNIALINQRHPDAKDADRKCSEEIKAAMQRLVESFKA